MKKLIKWLQWLDENLIKILLVGFIFIIPLYPKLPLFNVNYTYIAIRAEDLYIAFIGIAFLIQLLRRKVTLSTRFLVAFIVFWAIIMLSYYVGAYVQKTIRIPNVGLLNALRRVEYMFIFFVAASSLRSKKDFHFYLNCILITLGLVCIYGVGQKIFGWCAIQTMNEEFAKGYCLTLSSEARISSTFAGHYDLAAYLTFLIPIVLGVLIWKSTKTWKRIYFVIFTLALAALVMTSSRASYAAYIGSTIPFLLFRKRFKLLALVVVMTIGFTLLSNDLTTRIKRTFQYTKVFVDPKTGEVVVPQDLKQLPPGTIDERIDVSKLPTTGPGTSGKPGVKPVINDPAADIKAKEKIRETVLAEAKKKGIFLTEEEVQAQVNDLFNEKIPIGRFLPDISQSVRYKISWPRAINAFLFNPFLGKGPSSITEATDGDYFRWLGETGILGTVSFIYIFLLIAYFILRNIKRVPVDESHMFYGFIFGLLGLLINATYIDVFEASKVAYNFWLIAGLFTAAIALPHKASDKT